jgi:hypothetical protein
VIARVDPSTANRPSLNLQMRRVPARRVDRRFGRTAALLAGGASGLLLLASRRTRGYAAAGALVLLAGALAAATVTERRRRAREAELDRRIAESFPASDPGARP